MPWKPLKERLKDLPLVLAGPILRQVTPDAVTVWVALQRQALVTLKVLEKGVAPLPILMQASRLTTAVGKNVHIVAVTARRKKALSENNLYFYDLEFLNAGLRTGTLAEAVTAKGSREDPTLLAYPSDTTLPSFALPPSDLNKLRLVHGSCRKPHGGGSDALALLDGLIAATVASPEERPHQLMLTGDQIYADDVEDALLAALTDAGDTLLGWDSPESMPNVGEAAKLPPTTRSEVIKKAGFTSDDTRSHLMWLGEYLAMHLFAWSDVLWTDLPLLDELRKMIPTLDPRTHGQDEVLLLHRNFALASDDILNRRTLVENYRKTLREVRRALANVPTYMNFDDHEITDDWNMTRKFCETVYRNETGLGMRIVQNGLVAFAICQAWGNVPEQFETIDTPGFKLLENLETVNRLGNNASKYVGLSLDFMQIVGLRPSRELQKKSVYRLHDPAGTSLRYHFSVEGPSHQIIVTDTRTWRAYFSPFSHSDLILKDEFDAQLNIRESNKHVVPPLLNRLLIVVLSTNAPPIATIRFLAAKAAPIRLEMLHEFDLNDSWEFPSRLFDHLIVALSKKLPLNGDTHAGQAILLSGDVHFSFSSRLAYWADQRLGDLLGQSKKCEMVVAQLVASSLRNEEEKTLGMHNIGYRFLPKKAQNFLDQLANVSPLLAALLPLAVLPADVPEGYAGWNTQEDTRAVGSRKHPLLKELGPFTGGTMPPLILTTSETSPTLDLNLFIHKEVTLEKPHYRYRLDYLKTSRTGQTAPGKPTIGSVNTADRRAAIQPHADSHRAHLNLISSGATPRDCVGHNNIGEITFVWQRADKRPAASANDSLAINKLVQHTLSWQDPKTKGRHWAQYDVSFNKKDGEKGGKYERILEDHEQL